MEAVNIWIEGNGWKPALTKQGHKFTSAVIQDHPHVRVKKIRNTEAVTMPLLKDGKPYCKTEFALKILDFGERYGITKGALTLINEV